MFLPPGKVPKLFFLFLNKYKVNCNISLIDKTLPCLRGYSLETEIFKEYSSSLVQSNKNSFKIKLEFTVKLSNEYRQHQECMLPTDVNVKSYFSLAILAR